MSARRIIAWQLSLFGWAPKACYAWRRAWFQWRFMGEPVPLSDDEQRQLRMLHADSLRETTS